jgi:phage-related protein
MGTRLWQFYAVSPMVQDWFDGLETESKDEIRDRLSYIINLEHHLWSNFKNLGDGLSEIKVRVSALNKWIRLYGYFYPERHHYTIFHANEKKTRNAKPDKQLARDRKSKIDRNEGTINVFNFEEDNTLPAEEE